MKRFSTALVLAVALCAQAQESVRPELAKPLQQAQELIKAGKAREALAQLKQADAITGRTPYEAFVLERMRGSAAALAGDQELMLKAFDAVLAAGRLTADEQVKVLEAQASAAFRIKDYSRSAGYARRAIAQGSTSAAARMLFVQAMFSAQQYADAARELASQVRAAEQQGRIPSELELQLLANCQSKLNDRSGYGETLLRLVTSYPKKEYWSAVLSRLRNQPGFADRLALDLYRIRQATGVWSGAEDDVEMAQLALQAGVPAEAKRVVEAGYAAGRLGTGAEADRHRRLRDLALKQAAEDARNADDELAQAKDAQVLVKLGLALVMSGQVDKGLGAIDRGLAKGGLKHPDDATLHYGVALVAAGRTAQARELFRQIRGGDGSADLARLWMAHLAGATPSSTPK